jgi:L-amino acid N-acyltransferase YncA
MVIRSYGCRHVAGISPAGYRERMLSTRPATQDDASEIAHVHVDSWRTTYAGIVPDEYLAALNEPERTAAWKEWLVRDVLAYVAALDGRVVGFISGGSIREQIETYDAELYAIYLLQHAQGQGVGTALLQQLATSLRSNGFQSMTVWVLEQNPAKHFYIRTGAQLLTSKDIEIGGATLTEVAFGWPDLKLLERRL